jgi:hypothetical protein
MSTNGDTSGNTGTFTSGTYVFAGSNSLTMHQSTGAGGVHTLWVKPAMSYLTSGNNLISLSSNGSTVSIIGQGAGTGTSATNASITLNTNGLAISVDAPAGGGYTAYTYQNRQLGASTTLNSMGGQNSLWLVPFRVAAPVSASTILAAMISYTGTITSAATAQAGQSIRVAIYSQIASETSRFDTWWTGGASLTVWNSGTSSYSYAYAQSGGTTQTNSAGSNLATQSVMGVRHIILPIGSTLQTGLYMFGILQSSSSAGYSAAMSRMAMYMDNPVSIGMGTFGQNTAASIGYVDAGTYLTTTGALPATVGTNQTGAVNNVVPYFKIGAL